MASGYSSKKNSVLNEEISLGFCADHARNNEAFCENCKVLICPNCLMFGLHQGHKALEPDKACELIKEAMGKATRQGKLAASHSQRFLLDVRDAKIKVLQSQEVVKEQIEVTFKSLINTLKRSKEKLEDHIFTHFQQESNSIEQEEQIWLEKQNLGKSILEYSNDPNDENLLQNSLFIFNSIDILNENPSNQDINLINSVDLTAEIAEKQVGFAELLRIFSVLGKFGDQKNLQFRN